MIHKMFGAFKIPLVIAIILIIISLLTLMFRRGDSRLQEADSSYYQGEAAKTIDSRKTAFNHALELYLKLDNEYQPNFGNGKLDYNIANTYFQLRQYPWAILYYERARALMPREERVQSNLAITQDKLQLAHLESGNVFWSILFFHAYLSLPERLQFFSVVVLIALFSCSVWIWRPNLWVKRAAVVSLILLMLISLSLVYTRYLAPIEAIVVKSVELRRDAGAEYAKVTKEPIPAGTKLEVLKVSSNGKWLKVLTPKGDLGYVFNETIRLIDGL